MSGRVKGGFRPLENGRRRATALQARTAAAAGVQVAAIMSGMGAVLAPLGARLVAGEPIWRCNTREDASGRAGKRQAGGPLIQSYADRFTLALPPHMVL